jgi:hypothetical protein
MITAVTALVATRGFSEHADIFQKSSHSNQLAVRS